MPKTTEPVEGSESHETPETDNSTRTDPEAVQEAPEGQEEAFSRDYVESLREEAKTNRLKAQRADWLETEAKRLALREATRGVLSDPDSLPWDDQWISDDQIDHAAIRKAAEALAQAKPWLTRPRGDVGQGQHGSTSEGMPSLSALLRG